MIGCDSIADLLQEGREGGESGEGREEGRGGKERGEERRRG